MFLLRAYYTELVPDWEERLPWLMLAAREVTQASTGFSPNELVFGHTVQGPLEQVDWKTLPPPVNLGDYVNGFRRRFYETGKQAKVHLKGLIATPDCRRKSQLFNVNLLKPYNVPVCGAEDVTPIVVAAFSEGLVSGRVETGEECLSDGSILQGCLRNSELLSNLDAWLGHLAESNKEEWKKLTLSFH